MPQHHDQLETAHTTVIHHFYVINIQWNVRVYYVEWDRGVSMEFWWVGIDDDEIIRLTTGSRRGRGRQAWDFSFINPQTQGLFKTKFLQFYLISSPFCQFHTLFRFFFFFFPHVTFFPSFLGNVILMPGKEWLLVLYSTILLCCGYVTWSASFHHP